MWREEIKLREHEVNLSEEKNLFAHRYTLRGDDDQLCRHKIFLDKLKNVSVTLKKSHSKNY